MTTSPLRSLQAICLLSAMAFAFSSCLKDECKQFYSYKVFTPVYLSYNDLRKPITTSTSATLQDIGKIYYKAPFIFVNEVNKGIHVIDNSDPSSPQNVAFINIPGNLDIAVKDNILYADSYIDLVAIDISDPLHAQEIWRDQQVFDQRMYQGWWSGDATMGVITDWVERDTTVEQDCYNPGIWTMFEGDLALNFSSSTGGGGGGTTTMTTPGIGVAGSMARFGIASDHLYCLNTSTITLFDIANATSPIDQGVVTGLWNAETIFPYGENLFVGTTTGVSIYNNSNPSSPSLLSTVTHVTGCDPVVAQGEYAYSTIHSGNFCGQSFNELSVINISKPSSPYITNTYSLNSPYGLGIDGSNLFVCDDAHGLKRYDATDPNSLILKDEISAGTTRDVIATSGWLLLVSVEGLYQYNYSADALTQLSFLPVYRP